MRDILAKAATASMIAGAALLVSACGGTKAGNTTTNTMPIENYNSSDTMGGNFSDANLSAMGNSLPPVAAPAPAAHGNSAH